MSLLSWQQGWGFQPRLKRPRFGWYAWRWPGDSPLMSIKLPSAPYKLCRGFGSALNGPLLTYWMQMHANPQLAKIIICCINKNGIEKDRGGETPKANTAVVTAGDCSFQLFFFLISLPNFKRRLIRNRKDILGISCTQRSFWQNEPAPTW